MARHYVSKLRKCHDSQKTLYMFNVHELSNMVTLRSDIKDLQHHRSVTAKAEGPKYVKQQCTRKPKIL